MRLAHLTDLHLPIHKRPRLAALLSQRILGYQSWLRKRHKRHQQWALDALVEDLKGQNCDAVLISGDITNIALPEEFSDAKRWLDTHMAPWPTTMVPGNHDSYTDIAWDKGMGQIGAYMRGWPDLPGGPSQPRRDAQDFPFVADIGDAPGICVINVNSSPTSPPGFASGRIGASQLQRLEALLTDADAQGLYRLVMLHHPVTDGVVSRRKGLDDKAAFQGVIARTGADLILHGHTHFPVHDSLPGPGGPVPVVGGGSASHTVGHGRYTPARYGLIDIERTPDGWHTALAIRELNVDTGAVETQRSSSALAA